MNYSIQKLPDQINDVQFSTYYKNICCVGTFNYNDWYHSGDLYVLHVNHEKDDETGDEQVATEVLAKYQNRIGINALTWSEQYMNIVSCANHDGSMTMWNVNNGKRLVNVQAEKGHALQAIDWNNMEFDLLLTGSYSSRIKLFDINNLEIIVAIFAEHTKTVNAVKWNNNNKDEFASVSEDGLCKIWDRRSNTQTSVNTLLDRKSPGALRCCDWHKRDDWLLAVGNTSEQVIIWDTRNSLQPLFRRYAHGSSKKQSKTRIAVSDVRFDSNDANRFITAGEDHSVRVWSTRDTSAENKRDEDSSGIYLTEEHLIHRQEVNAVDWSIHDPNLIVSVSADNTVVSCSLSQITQVKEYENLEGALVTEKSNPRRPKRPISKL